MLVKVGHFVGQHKFFDADLRVSTIRQTKERFFMERFPAQPPVFIPSDLKTACAKNFITCIQYVDRTLHRDINNFTAPLQRFNVATVVSYYMCWWTVQEEPLLRFFGAECQVDKRIVDFRGLDRIPYGCALFNFCPDPCCGSAQNLAAKGFAATSEECDGAPKNPCSLTEASCFVDMKANRNLDRLISDGVVASCDCAAKERGFVWDRKLQLCVDVDECRDGNYDCENNSVCRNTAGSYYCTCRIGYRFDRDRRLCAVDHDFIFEDSLLSEVGVQLKKEKEGMIFSSVFGWLINGGSVVSDSCKTICLFLPGVQVLIDLLLSI